MKILRVPIEPTTAATVLGMLAVLAVGQQSCDGRAANRDPDLQERSARSEEPAYEGDSARY